MAHLAIRIARMGVRNTSCAPVARALYANVDVDQEIPQEQFKAVAEIIGYVFRLKGKMPAQNRP